MSKLSFSGGKYYDISISDINAGKLSLTATGWAAQGLKVKFAWVDTGSIANDA